MLNPHSLPKTLQKKASPSKKNKTAFKKTEKRTRRVEVRAGTAVQRRTVARAPHSRPCARRTGGRASRHDHNTTVLRRLAARAWLLSRVHGCATLLHGCVVCCFSLLCLRWCSGEFLEPLIFLEMALEIFLSIKAQGFLLKVKQNTF